MTGDSASSARIGRRLLIGALVGLGLWLLASGGWIVWKAIQNPDVQTKRPSWLSPDQVFDASFWTPLFLTVVIGSFLVGWIFWRAYRRMKRGEDIYRNRYGRGQRRRGERRVGEWESGR